uniref:Uncharacterized protein n=1 Tax=Cacopsylla melanoneura TaxID=428564 RepID=A0A8D8S3M8_9HEMI
MYKNLSTFSLNCTKLLFFLKLCGLMHVDLENRRPHISPAAITYTLYLIALTISATTFVFLNIEVNFFNVKNKEAEGKFVIAFVTLIIFQFVDTVFVVAAMSFSLKVCVMYLFFYLNLHFILYYYC